MRNEVTAVVLNYRTPAKTLACLESLLGDGIRRVILVDNSEDEGASLANMHSGLAQARARGAAIDVLTEERNLGFAAGVNLALRHLGATGGGSALLVNSDARLEPGALGLLNDAMAAGADLASPVLVSPDGHVHEPVFHYQKYLGLLTRRAWPGTFSYITGACMLLGPTLIRAHLFDEDFFFYGEDVMLGASMAREGRTCRVVPAAKAFHEGAGSSRNGSFFYEYHINRGHWLLARKLSRGPLEHATSLVGRGLILPARALVRALRFRSWVPLRACWHALRGRSVTTAA